VFWGQEEMSENLTDNVLAENCHTFEMTPRQKLMTNPDENKTLSR